MMPTHPVRRMALALPVIAAALAMPAFPSEAAVVHTPAGTHRHGGWAEPAWSATAFDAVAPRLGAVPALECTGCGEILSAAPHARRSATLSVNVAILVLGTLWVGLMLRRIHLRSAMGDLRGAAPRHAAGGH